MINLDEVYINEPLNKSKFFGQATPTIRGGAEVKKKYIFCIGHLSKHKSFFFGGGEMSERGLLL